jgi:hypothetical protein
MEEALSFMTRSDEQAEAPSGTATRRYGAMNTASTAQAEPMKCNMRTSFFLRRLSATQPQGMKITRVQQQKLHNCARDIVERCLA